MNRSKGALVIFSVSVLVVLSAVVLTGGANKAGATTSTTTRSTVCQEIMYTATDPLGAEHIAMDHLYGASCWGCHDGMVQEAPRSLVGVPYVAMGNGQACTYCHDGRYIPALFISQMTTDNSFGQCANCHVVQ